MALTRVSRHIIDEPFNPTTVSATDVTATNINASGIGTVGTLNVTGNLTVQGTTTTLDTILTEVDKLEVGADNNTVGVAITQSGTGDIFNLYDGSTEVFTVTDGGKVGVGEDNVQAHFHVAKNIADSDAINWTGSQLSVATPIAGNNTANRATIYFAPYGSDNNYAPSAISASAGTSGASTLKFFTNPSGNLTGQVQNYERLRITSDGQIDVKYGVINLGTADSSSGHVNAYENMSFNIDIDNDDTNRYFTWHTNGNSASGTELMRLTEGGNIGIGTNNAVAKVDVVTGTGDGTQNEANCLRLRNRGNNGNAMTLQVGVNTAAVGGFNQGYAYLQGRFWGGGNNPILLNPKGGNIGIGRTGAYVPLDVNGDTILRTAGNTTQGDLTRKYGFTGPSNTSNPTSYIAGVADKTNWYQGLGLVFATVSGNDIGNTLGVERMRITSDGDVGIGTDNPDVYSLGGNNRYAAIKASAGYTVLNLVDSNNSGSYLQYGNSSVRRGSLHFDSSSNFIITVNASNSGTTLTEALRITGFGTCKLPDGGKLTLGAGDDLEIYHNSNHSIINNSTGDLRIESDRIELLNNASNKFYLTTTVDEEINLYYNSPRNLKPQTLVQR